MKKIKINVRTLIARLSAIGLAVLGFSCSDKEQPDMYGCPYGEFEVKGEVVTEDNQVVEGATIRVTDPEISSDRYSFGTSTTNDEGKYEVEIKNALMDKAKVVCLPDNPALEADSVVVDVEYIKNKNDKDSWHLGEAEATVNFKLKNKGEAK